MPSRIIFGSFTAEECGAILGALLSKERILEQETDDAHKVMYHDCHNARLKFKEAVDNSSHMTSKDCDKVRALMTEEMAEIERNWL